MTTAVSVVPSLAAFALAAFLRSSGPRVDGSLPGRPDRAPPPAGCQSELTPCPRDATPSRGPRSSSRMGLRADRCGRNRVDAPGEAAALDPFDARGVSSWPRAAANASRRFHAVAATMIASSPDVTDTRGGEWFRRETSRDPGCGGVAGWTVARCAWTVGRVQPHASRAGGGSFSPRAAKVDALVIDPKHPCLCSATSFLILDGEE
jgi:hypothetical protein